MPKYYTLNLNLKAKKCVVVGGGRIAQRKVKRLLACDACVTLISPEIRPGLTRLGKNKKIEIKKRKLILRDLQGAFLVIAATDDNNVNVSVSSYCRKKDILVNVVDVPALCNFIVPAILTQGDLTISVSTGGACPTLSKKIRQDLEKEFGAEYSKFLRIMKKLRPKVIKKLPTLKARKIFFTKVVNSEILELLKKNQEKQAMRLLTQMMGHE